METIPTPRCDENLWVAEDYHDVVDATLARQLERELHIAKQALVEINVIMQDEICGLVEFDQCRQKVTETLNTLSA